MRRPRSRISVLLVTMGLVVSACSVESETLATSTDRSRGLTLPGPEITAADLRAHVEYLADDERGGRYPGTAGIEAAEAYIHGEFERAGLSTSYHEFTVYQHGFVADATSITVRSNSASRSGRLDRDFVPFWFSGSGTLETELIFAGYGITAPELDYDDYEGIDVTGKVVFMFRHEPEEDDPESRFNGDEFTRHAYFVTKAETAYRRGAAGFVLVTDPLHHEGDDFVLMPSMSRSESPSDHREGRGGEPELDDDFLALHITQELARFIADEWDVPLESLQESLDRGATPAAMALPSLDVSISVTPRAAGTPVAVRNVVGKKTSLGAESWIVIGAHHDHLGEGAGSEDRIYNGADDNASGVAAVLELAAGLKGISGHNLLFVTFSAEEHGLFGSKVFVEEEVVPVEDIAAMVNFDMIGRNSDQPVELYLGRFEPQAAGRVRDAAESHSVEFNVTTGRMRAASDHYPFHEKNVPVLNFFTGPHDDYHQPSDEADTLDYQRMTEIVRAAEIMVRALTSPPTS